MKDKSIKAFLIAAAFTLAALAALFSVVGILYVEKTVGSCYTRLLNDEYDAELKITQSDSPVEQEFTCTREMFAAGLRITSVDGASGSLSISILDSSTGGLLAAGKVDVKDINLLGYTIFTFDSSVLSGNPCLLSLSTEKLSGSVLLSVSTGADKLDGALSAGGNSLDNDLALCVSTDRINESFVIFFTICAILISAFSVFIEYLLIMKKPPVHKLFLAVIIGVSMIYMLFLPPYTAPDEWVHIDSAYTLSNKLMGIEQDTGNHKVVVKRACDAQDLNEMKKNMSSKFGLKQTYEGLFSLAENDELTDAPSYAYNYGGIHFLLYFLPALGITLGRILGLGMIPTLLLGRMLNAALFIAFAYYSIKLIPVGKSVIAAVSLLPPLLNTVCSFSYDVSTLSLSFLFIALCIRCCHSEQAAVSGRTVALMAAAAVLLAPLKYIYLPVAALCLAIPREKFGGRRREIISKSAILGGGVLSFSIFNLNTVVSLLRTTAAAMISRVSLFCAGISRVAGVAPVIDYAARDAQTFSLSMLLSDLKTFFYLIVNTIDRNLSVYICEIAGRPLAYDLDIDILFVLAFWVILLLAAVKPAEENPISRRERFTSLGIFAAFTAVLFMACLIMWTPTYYTEIHGIQGRYFLPLLPMLLLSLRSGFISSKRDMTAGLITASMFLNILVAMNVLKLIA